jgi:hypothetical protein
MKPLLLAVFSCLVASVSAAQEPNSAAELAAKTREPIQWMGEADAQADQALAILNSYDIDLRDCEIGLKVSGRGSMLQESKIACYKSLEVGISGSRYYQALEKISSLGKSGAVGTPVIEEGLVIGKRTQRRWAFIRERLLR